MAANLEIDLVRRNRNKNTIKNLLLSNTKFITNGKSTLRDRRNSCNYMGYHLSGRLLHWRHHPYSIGDSHNSHFAKSN